ncbi:ENTH-domain-containing protein [Dothidotthia symphoricarpi CBS 119687]|uniref:ENTH-domain-containing protein n=1 Tax=Dothidotthia symphoricarpi CBS 119687 TaxID=1392245 RepID=A0A6A6AGU4_9PLEO|nr:ENTH-domain-containing protein [Dothidotthia symphoricarpi CBS 119687]KAF2130463.1 ENTH-domain-containing protein [Dothidotthia symphoricarpi CBS 119687]
MSKVVRSVKNVTKGYSAVEVKVRNATSNDPWGPVGSDMAEIAQITFNNSTDFYQVMDMLDKRLNDKGKNWRHVLKSLKVLDYCLHEGSELVVTWARKNIYIIKTLREFQYIDEDGHDVGQNVRMAAKELTTLIMDEDRLRAERADRKSWKSRVTGIEEYPGNNRAIIGEGSQQRRPRDREQGRPRRTDEEEFEMRLALEASKNEAEAEKQRRAKSSTVTDDDEDLAKAIKLSKEEEELRRKELEQTNADLLFGDAPAQPTSYQPTGNNQGYQQQGQVDWFGNLVDQNQQQPQSTGFLNNAYSQPTGMQAQQTGFQNGYGGYNGLQAQQQQPQPTGFDQFGNQQAQYMQPQQTSFNMNNPYGQFGGGFGDMGQQQQQQQQQLQQQQQQPLQEQSTLQPGSHNPWASKSQDPLMPQPTGSNNPFASGFNRPQTAQAQRVPTLNTLHEQQSQAPYNNTPFSASTSFLAPQQQAQPVQQAQPMQQAQPTQPQKEMDPHAARLNALLASGEGQDTFGNVGNLRIPSQHTAPGTFVNSAGAGLNRVNANATGNNPFLNSQFTGMPQQNRLMPAQTGPAGNFGANPYGGVSANPFGAPPQGTRQAGGNNLIDL